jgi:hypothetical protein
MIQRDGKELVRPQSRIVAVLPVHDIVEMGALGVPKALIERTAGPLSMMGQLTTCEGPCGPSG